MRRSIACSLAPLILAACPTPPEPTTPAASAPAAPGVTAEPGAPSVTAEPGAPSASADPRAPNDVEPPCSPLPAAPPSPPTTERPFVLRGEVNTQADWGISQAFASSGSERVFEHTAVAVDDSVLSLYAATLHDDRCVRVYELEQRDDRWVRHLVLAAPISPRKLRPFVVERGQLRFGGPEGRLRYAVGSRAAPVPDEGTPEAPRRQFAPATRRTVKLAGATLQVVEGEVSTKVIDEANGVWQFGEVEWAADGEVFYFDNVGAVACIWEYDVRHRSLSKIIADHDATGPHVFDLREDERRIVYRRPGGVFIASRGLPVPAPWRRAIAPAAMKRAIATLPAKWTLLTPKAKSFVVEHHCDAETPSVELDTRAPSGITLFMGFGQEGELDEVTGTSTRTDELALTYRTAGGRADHQLRIRYDRRAKVGWIASSAEGAEQRPFVADAQRAAFKTVEADCMEQP